MYKIAIQITPHLFSSSNCLLLCFLVLEPVSHRKMDKDD